MSVITIKMGIAFKSSITQVIHQHTIPLACPAIDWVFEWTLDECLDLHSKPPH